MTKKTPSKWLDRWLIVSPYYYCLCLTEEDFHKQLKYLNVPTNQYPDFVNTRQADASAHYFDAPGNKVCCIVTLRIPKKKKLEEYQVFALLVHEAVHIWQAICKYIGEDKPSAEMEAYSIQALSQSLFESYLEQTSGIKIKL